MGDEIGGPQQAGPPFDDAVHPSITLGKLALPIGGHCKKRAGHDPHGRAVPPLPTLHLGEMTLPLTTGQEELALMVWAEGAGSAASLR